MPRGGKRIGAGKPAGSTNRRTRAIGITLDRLVPDEALAGLLWKMAQDGDVRAAIYLADRKWGRIPNPVPDDGDDSQPRVLIVDRSRLNIPV
jgi:hypothetical protein